MGDADVAAAEFAASSMIAGGERVRAFGRLAGRLPVLSAPLDLLSERHSIDALVAAVQADPRDIAAHLWLGEALQAMQADTPRFDQVRARVALNDPVLFVFSRAMRAGSAPGAAPTDPAAQVLDGCRHLAATRLRSDPRDATALHAFARVELATGHPDRAVQPAKLAVAASTGDDRARALVTLARAYLAVDRDASAANVARKAVAAGCSLGWEILAELLYRGAGPADSAGTARHRRYVELRGRISDDDRRAYHGAY